jgi:nicotinamidase-related amidase
MKSALVLVDIQQDYFPQGKMELVGAIEASKAARRLLDHFREKGLPIIHVKHISTRPDAGYFLPHTSGIEFHESVVPLPGETVIEKHFPNSFRDTTLEDHLSSRGISELAICGMTSHMCIDATVRAAVDKGYTCHVAHDACATRNLTFLGAEIPAAQVHGAYMAALGAMYAKIASVAEIAAFIRNK